VLTVAAEAARSRSIELTFRITESDFLPTERFGSDFRIDDSDLPGTVWRIRARGMGGGGKREATPSCPRRNRARTSHCDRATDAFPPLARGQALARNGQAALGLPNLRVDPEGNLSGSLASSDIYAAARRRLTFRSTAQPKTWRSEIS